MACLVQGKREPNPAGFSPRCKTRQAGGGNLPAPGKRRGAALGVGVGCGSGVGRVSIIDYEKTLEVRVNYLMPVGGSSP